MTDPTPYLDRIEQSIADARTEFHQTTTAYTKMKQPISPSSHWGKGDAWLDDAVLGAEELRALLTPPPPPPPPPSFDPRTNWQRKPWNEDATAQPVDPLSAALVSTWVSRGNIKSPNVCTNAYSQAWCVGGANDPRCTINVVTYGKKTILAVPIPVGTKSSSDSDAHLVIFDTVAKREIDLWQAKQLDGFTWQAGSGDVFPLGSDPAPGQGSNAAGFPAMALSIWPEEIAAGHIDHALAFSVLKAKGKTLPQPFRYPATKTDGVGDAQDLPEGVWLAMPYLEIPNTTWPKWLWPIWNALKDHGMYLMDQGGSLGIAGVNPINGGMKWSDVGMGTGGSIQLPSDFPFASMRVLAEPTP